MSPRKRSEPAPSIAVMDTTLRDGEQTPDVAYSPAEKRQLARLLLLEVQVDRIEIASTRVSEGEKEAAQRVTDWARKARMLQRVEILGYTDGKASVDWIVGVGGKVLNLLTKGSERHCRTQLGKTPKDIVSDIIGGEDNFRFNGFGMGSTYKDWKTSCRHQNASNREQLTRERF